MIYTTSDDEADSKLPFSPYLWGDAIEQSPVCYVVGIILAAMHGEAKGQGTY
jgi:hypothetical protein